ncbi:MAG: DAK2 domain-containing protein [Candidatus Xenobium sp.]|nr:DAK2 domain-containing protein [Burkholderiales bacterium]
MGITHCDGKLLKRLLVAGGRWLSLHRGILNQLNVFPVPDGDTGTNLSLTMRGALSPLLARRAPEKVGEVARAAARGALMGARGNSGVILSQILHGFAHGLSTCERADTDCLAQALEASSSAAYSAVLQPREGTILTVIREVAGRARQVARGTRELSEFFAALATHAREVLLSSRDELAVLKEAGVVDAGGLGLVYMLEGMLKVTHGQQLASPEELLPAILPARQVLESEIKFRYCTEFLVEGTDLEPETLRPVLEELGDSLVLARTCDLLKVHIHTDHPERIEALVTPGSRSFRRKVEDMHEQNQRRLEDLDRGISPALYESTSAEFQGELQLIEPPEDYLVAARGLPPMVSIASGEGLEAYFQAWGMEVVPGGQTLNPSTREILDAIQKVADSGEEVLVLPNNSNCTAAALQAARLAEVPVRVLDTSCPSQAVALLSQQDAPETLEERLGGLSCGEVTQAVKDAAIQGFQVRNGDYMALWGGRLAGVEATFSQAVLSLFQAPPRQEFSRLVLVAGEDCDPDEVEVLLLEIGRLHPAARVEFLWGGQPHHPALITLE